MALRGGIRRTSAAAAVAVCALAAAASGGGAAVPSPHTGQRLPARANGVLGHASLKTGFCGKSTELVCRDVVVPLDRSGAVPGTITLHVEVLPAKTPTPAGVMFLIAGGPGQGSAHVFGLGSDNADQLYRFLFPNYTIVAYDDRGTGASGLIDCQPLQAALTEEQNRAAAAACGNALGPAAPFYGTLDHAADLDAVRVALGAEQVGLFGVSYGTKLAQAYALAYPTHVSRILLDSVLPVQLDDTYATNVLQNLPTTLPAYCTFGGCKGSTLTNDIVAVANKLAGKPVVGKVLLADGRTKSQRVDGLEVLSITLSADLSPGIAAQLPGVMHAAHLGNMQPLLRLAALNDAENAEPSVDLSAGLYAATVCRDGPFPWAPNAAPADRAAALQADIAARPQGAFGPFGPWAAEFGNADFCLQWPGPTGGVTYGPGPFPDVPMLAVSGGLDMRTPLKGAREVTAQFPHGQLLVVPSVGHSTTTADATGCAARGVRQWIATGTAPSSCAPVKPYVLPVPTLPAPGTGKKPLTARATYAVAASAVHDGQSLWLLTAAFSGGTERTAGLYGGHIVAGVRRVTFVKYQLARGVTINGTLTLKKLGPPVQFQGAVVVGGPAAAHGVLSVSGATVGGSLNGRAVG
jgi:pimeloyl-ACP methyl ester carboxylesterase